MDCKNCFTCGQKPADFYVISSSAVLEPKQDINNIICQHFWFQEHDLLDGIICVPCWAKVDEFHRFYQEVKLLHEQRLDSKHLTVFTKQEEIEIESAQFELSENGLLAEAEGGKPYSDRFGCKFEPGVEVCINLPQSTENIGSKPRNPRTPRKASTKDKPTSKSAPKRISIPLDQQKAEDDFIKQHRPYVCSDCFKEFDSFCAIRTHAYNTHRKNYITCCGTQHTTRSKLYQHVQNLLNPGAIRCEICNKTFKSQDGHIRHKEEVHPEEHQLIFQCPRCPKSFPKQKLLQRHVSEHETLENERAKCHICGKCFKRQLLLKKHVDTVHVEKIYDFICELCSRRFSRLSELTTHRRKTHELTAEQMRKQCPVCNKWLKNRNYWRTHVQSHKEQGQYQCERCDHVSVNLLALKRHTERKHSNVIQKYPCEVCGKEYSRPVTLKEHIANAHTGEPLYQCLYCEKKFFSNATMYAHKKKMHPQEWMKDRMTKYATTEKEEDKDEGI